MAASIESKGLLQPILVRVGEGDDYVIVAGERRYRAHKLLNRPTIAAIITSGNTDEIALIENIQRENLRPLEEAEALQRLIDRHSYTHEDVARVIGKARNTITALLSMLTIPEDIRAECSADDRISKSFLIELASVPHAKQREMWEALQGRPKTGDAVRKAKTEQREADSPFVKTLRAFKICTKTLESSGAQLSAEEIATILQAKNELDAVIEKVTRQ